MIDHANLNSGLSLGGAILFGRMREADRMRMIEVDCIVRNNHGDVISRVFQRLAGDGRDFCLGCPEITLDLLSSATAQEPCLFGLLGDGLRLAPRGGEQ